MNYEDFIEDFVDILEIEADTEIDKDTELEALDEWESVRIMSLKMFYENQGVNEIQLKKIDEAITINDIFIIVCK